MGDVPDPLSPEAIRDALARILGSKAFADSPRLSAFLRFVVSEWLAGRTGEIKGYTIGVAVFERGEGFDPNTDPIVRVEATRLRRLLSQYYLNEGAEDPIILELPRGGYVPEARRRVAEAATPALRTAGPAPFEEAVPAVLPPPQVWPFAALWERIQARPEAMLAVFAVLVAGAVFAGFLLRGADGPLETPSIAVMPFDNVGGRVSDTFFAQGLTVEIASELSRFKELAVFAVDPSGADSVRARYVLSGSVRRGGTTRGGNSIRVTATLSEKDGGRALWSNTFDRALSIENLLAIEQEIASAIVTEVAQPYGVIARTDAAASRGGGFTKLSAYQCVLRAYAYWRSLDEPTHGEVRTCLERAVKDDPSCSACWAALTFLYLDEYRYAFNRRDGYDPLDKALESSERAVEADSDSAFAYQAHYAAHYFRGDFAKFREAGERALALNPNSPDILADFGSRLAFSGDWVRGIEMVKRALAINPASPGWAFTPLAYDAYRRGDFEMALTFVDDMKMPAYFRTYVLKAQILSAMGDYDAAHNALQEALALKPEFAARPREFMEHWGLERGMIERSLDDLAKAGLTNPS